MQVHKNSCGATRGIRTDTSTCTNTSTSKGKHKRQRKKHLENLGFDTAVAEDASIYAVERDTTFRVACFTAVEHIAKTLNDTWACTACTFQNPILASACVICNKKYQGGGN